MEVILTNLIKDYIHNEFNYNEKPEKENSETHGRRTHKSNKENETVKDQEYIIALQECLEKKGILRELQAFLRHRLIQILQEKWPKLAVSSPSDLISPAIVKLIEDFLCCRKLLYTFSVLSSEIGIKYSGKVKFGKLPCIEAERLLEEIDIKKDSRLSRKILKLYCDKESSSLLECIIHSYGWYSEDSLAVLSLEDGVLEPLDHNAQKISKFKEIQNNKEEQKFNHNINKIQSGIDSLISISKNSSAEEKFLAIERGLEQSKATQLRLAIQKFRDEEVLKIKEEIKNQMEFEMLAKEKDLLKNYRDKCEHLKDNFEREKATWLLEKAQQEKDSSFEQKKINHENLLEIRKSTCSDCKLSIVQEEKQTSIVTKEVTENENELSKSNQTPQHFTESYANHQDFENDTNTIMKEARLRIVIKRLQEENKLLLAERKNVDIKQVIKDKCQCCKSTNSSHNESKHSENVNISKVDNDTIVFMQYNLERQAEEINLLKEKLNLEPNQVPPKTLGKFLSPEKDKDSELVHFLAESKQRCDKIESESKSIECKIQEIRSRRSRSSSPMIMQRRTPLTIAYNYSEGPFNIKQSLFDQIQPLYSPPKQLLPGTFTLRRPLLEWEQDESSVLSLPLSPTNPVPNKSENYIPGVNNLPETNIITSMNTQPTRNNPKLVNNPTIVYLKNNDSTNDLPNPNKSIQSSKSNMYKVKSLNEESSPKVEERRKSLSEKVEKALKKGALSFEKVVSEDEVSQDSSFKQLISSRQSRSNSKGKINDSPQYLKSSIQPTEKLDYSMTNEYSKQRVENNDEFSSGEKNLSMSGPNDISHGSGGGDSDFWKM